MENTQLHEASQLPAVDDKKKRKKSQATHVAQASNILHTQTGVEGCCLYTHVCDSVVLPLPSSLENWEHVQEIPLGQIKKNIIVTQGNYVLTLASHKLCGIYVRVHAWSRQPVHVDIITCQPMHTVIITRSSH